LKPLLEPLRHSASVSWAKFSHDGRSIATASEDEPRAFGTRKQGEPIGEPMNHRDLVWTAEFSPDDLRS
jgi:WD40 repeat protein